MQNSGETWLWRWLVHPELGCVAVTLVTSGMQRGAGVQQWEGKSPSPR